MSIWPYSAWVQGLVASTVQPRLENYSVQRIFRQRDQKISANSHSHLLPGHCSSVSHHGHWLQHGLCRSEKHLQAWQLNRPAHLFEAPQSQPSNLHDMLKLATSSMQFLREDLICEHNEFCLSKQAIAVNLQRSVLSQFFEQWPTLMHCQTLAIDAKIVRFLNNFSNTQLDAFFTTITHFHIQKKGDEYMILSSYYDDMMIIIENLQSRFSFSRLLIRCSRILRDSSSSLTRVRTALSSKRTSWACSAATLTFSKCCLMRDWFRKNETTPYNHALD